MKKWKCKFQSLIESLKIINKFDSLLILFSFLQILIKAILPILYVYFPKLLIDLLTQQNTKYGQIVKIICIYAIILLALNIFNSILENKIKLHTDIFSKKIKNKIGFISMQLKFQDLENTETQDLIKLASKTSEITYSLIYLQNIIANIITIIGLTYLILKLDFIFIVIICISLIVKIITIYIEQRHNKKMRKLLAENSRYNEYLFHIAFNNKGSAKEIRTNNLEQWYASKNKQYRQEMVQLQNQSFKLFASHNIINEIVLAIQSFIVLYFLSKNFIEKNITLADFTLYFNSITSLTITISSITTQISNYNQQILNIQDYKSLNKLFEYYIKEEIDHIDIDKNDIEIEFKNVSFTYPNTTKQILNNINIKIKHKEKLVIVGLNGAGKTTFIKLLCKFYKPTEGIITLNKINIWDIPNEEYYNMISAVFQDFQNFAFSIKENVTMSECGDDELFNEVLNEVHLNNYVDSLSNKEDTYINRIFDDSGIELSGGFNQKLAIARCIYKKCPIVILDEPTANLDPIAENEIYRTFFNISKNKTAIFISHRLAVSTIATNIAVFVNGQIVEYGTHKKLMEEKSIYYEMFLKQSKNYLDK